MNQQLVKKFVLGTAQGTPSYSLTLNDYVPLAGIIELANRLGVSYLDTSPAYGTAYNAIKNAKSAFKVTTKIPSLQGIKGKDALKRIESFLEGLNSSLPGQTIDTIYFHNEEDLLGSGSYERFELVRSWCLANKPYIKVGFSSYSPASCEKIIKRFEIDSIQLPFNLLDFRYLPLAHKLKEQNIEICARSLFHRGLFFIPPPELPKNYAHLKENLTILWNICRKEKMTPSRASVLLCESLLRPDKYVIGVNTPHQLKIILNYSFVAPKPAFILDSFLQNILTINQSIKAHESGSSLQYSL